MSIIPLYPELYKDTGVWSAIKKSSITHKSIAKTFSRYFLINHQPGGNIVGKTVCEDMCYSVLSCTASTGPVKNPIDSKLSAGGSSSGSAALVSLYTFTSSKQKCIGLIFKRLFLSFCWIKLSTIHLFLNSY